MNPWNQYTLEKSHTLILLIDFQERILSAMDQKEFITEQLKTLLASAKILNIPLITMEQYPKGLGHTAPELQSFVQTSPLLEKRSFSAWSNDLKKLLEYYDTRQILVGGIESHVCVFQTVRDLLGNGYQVFVLQDGISSRTRENKSNALVQMKDMGAIITNVETILFDLLQTSAAPEFKAISALLK